MKFENGLEQGFSTGALGPHWGPRAKAFTEKLRRDIAEPKTKLGIFIDEQGPASVGSLWKGDTSHESLIITGLMHRCCCQSRRQAEKRAFILARNTTCFGGVTRIGACRYDGFHGLYRVEVHAKRFNSPTSKSNWRALTVRSIQSNGLLTLGGIDSYTTTRPRTYSGTSVES